MLCQSDTMRFSITPERIPNQGILFVDHSLQKRSGHLGHAMAEYAPGKILAFYADCEGEPLEGHTCAGWTEFRRSEDGGETWSEPQPVPFTKALYDNRTGATAFAEKALCADDGTVTVFLLVSDYAKNNGIAWEPYRLPLTVTTRDGGRTWSEPAVLWEEPGRVFDAIKRDGVWYVLLEVSENPCALPAHYDLLVSTDDGATFTRRSTLPFACEGETHMYYGTMEFQQDGALLVYAYYDTDEKNLPYTVSRDGGSTWSPVQTARFERQMRNPQLVRFGGHYFMLGRSGSDGEPALSNHGIVYHAADGVTWDEGQYLILRSPQCQVDGKGWAAYSNTLIVHDPKRGERLLYQASYAYEAARTNILHWWIDAEAK